MALNFVMEKAHVILFVKCLGFLPNLHTLEITWSASPLSGKLRKALRRIELPQIKTLILPVTAHPLLERCHEVEDVVCVVAYDWNVSSEEFLRSLALNRDSKVRRLVIPLTPEWDQPFRK